METKDYVYRNEFAIMDDAGHGYHKMLPRIIQKWYCFTIEENLSFIGVFNKKRKTKMKKALLCAVCLGAFLTIPVFAQGSTGSQAPGTWVSSINIQYPDNNDMVTDPDANVTLKFYDSNGDLALSFDVTPAIPEGGSRSLYVPTDIPGLSDGQYSVVVTSNQPLEVVANSSSTSPSTAGAYTGIKSDEIGTTLFFPGLYKNYYGFYSEIVLQNAEVSDATNVNIAFYNQKTGDNVATIGPVTIPATSTRIFVLDDLAGVPSGNTNGLLSAKVTSDKSLAGVANIWSSAYDNEFADYNGYVSGSTSIVYAPALYNQYYGFVSALTVQNMSDTESVDIRVTYSNGSIETATLLPLQAIEYYQPNNLTLPSGNSDGVFSAKVESLTGQPIVVLVNVEDKTKGSLASYNGPSEATTEVNCPVVLQSYYEWFSAETVQNVGTDPTDITITYASGESRTFNDIPANGTVNIIELVEAGSVLPNGSSVAARIVSTGEPLVAVVQENSNDRYAGTPGDYLLAYTCVSN
jgi:hypothetical protein